MPDLPAQPEGSKSALEIAREVRERRAAQAAQPQEPPSSAEPRPLEEIMREDLARQVVEPAVNTVEELADEAVEHPEGKPEFFKDLWGRIKKAKENAAAGAKKTWDAGWEKAGEMADSFRLTVNHASRATKKFMKENQHEINMAMGKKPEDRRRKAAILILIGLVAAGAAYNWGEVLIDMLKKNNGDGHGGGVPTPEGQGEPNHDVYEAAALKSWQKFKDVGYMPGKMLDPLALDNPETILVSGYFPGWFCVPERIAVCEKMVGERIDYPGRDVQLPENPILRAAETKRIQAEQEVFFIQMQADWDEVWWLKIKANPNLSQEVKNFYDPANRDDLRQWYREHNPISMPLSEGFKVARQTVADKMFLRFLETGKLVPDRPSILTYSHLLGSFVAMVFTAGQPIQLPMTEAGFVPEEGGQKMQSGMLPANVREAYWQIEIISRRPDSNLLDIAPHAKIVNDYNAQIEISRQLNPGSLGRL